MAIEKAVSYYKTDQPEVSLPRLRSVRRLQYATFVLQAKNAMDEAMTGVCTPCCWM